MVKKKYRTNKPDPMLVLRHPLMDSLPVVFEASTPVGEVYAQAACVFLEPVVVIWTFLKLGLMAHLQGADGNDPCVKSPLGICPIS